MIKERLKEFFYEHPTKKFRLRQLERATKLPYPSVRRYVKELLEEGFLRKEVFAETVMYSANRVNPVFYRNKRHYNIEQIYASGLIDFIDAPTIVFGSYAQGMDTEESDIDLYIEKDVEIPKKFETILRKPIQTFCHKHIQEIPNPGLRDNILNGITLHGTITIFSKLD